MLETRDYRIDAVATSAGREYREGYATIRHRDLETRYLYRDAAASVRGVDMRIAPGLQVGYVMGVGDDVPSGLAQLGIDVQLLGERDLATADLSRFHAIFTGTRAYAVREDLKTYNRRLLDYVKDGGNLIVLYNTQEFVPKLYAPYGGELPRTARRSLGGGFASRDPRAGRPGPERAEPHHPRRLRRLGRAARIEVLDDVGRAVHADDRDVGQGPGAAEGRVAAGQVRQGHYTYFAYAFHRQLPYGVPGAYRLLANLLSLNQPPAAGSKE